MKYFFLSIFFGVVLFGTPHSARATEVGFVPSSGIWFSKQSIAPGESIKVYAVIINNAYPLVQATVAFYDNGDEAGTIEVNNLEQEQARELWIKWTPHPGSHKVTARFTHAAIIGLDGTKKILDPLMLNTIGESSFVAPAASGQTDIGAPETDARGSSIVQSANMLAGDGVTVQVKKEGDNLTLSIVPSNSAIDTGKKFGTIASPDNSGSSTLVDRTKNTVVSTVEKIKNIGESVRAAREITVRTIHDARGVIENSRARAEAAGNIFREMRRNKIALAWGGFLGFIVLAGILSYARWRKYR